MLQRQMQQQWQLRQLAAVAKVASPLSPKKMKCAYEAGTRRTNGFLDQGIVVLELWSAVSVLVMALR